MAINMHEHKDGEHLMLTRLLKHFGWEKSECYQNVHVFDWESDMLVISASGFVTEIEVKCTLADWRADMKKDKFEVKSVSQVFQRRVKFFYYAVTDAVYEQHLKNPVPLPVGCGILVYGRQELDRFSEVQQAVARPLATQLKPEERLKLLRSVYFRFNRLYIKGQPVAPAQPKKSVISKGKLVPGPSVQQAWGALLP